MRFDAARALVEAQNFAYDRLPWTAGGRRAVDQIEAAFQEAGYSVERTEVSGSPSARNRRIVLVYLTLFGGIAAALVLKGGGSGLAVRLGCIFAGFCASFAIPFLIARVPWFRGREVRTWNVSAHRADDSEHPGRLVILTALDVAPPVPRSNARLVTGRFYLGTLVFVLVLSSSPGRLPRPLVVALLVTLAAVTAAALVCRVRPFPGEGGTDNRDGLGFLVELARTWPPGKTARNEVRFLACGGEILDRAGLRSLGSELHDRWSEKPTLIVAAWSPGRSEAPMIFDSPGNSFAANAAKDLWIPFQSCSDPITFADVHATEFLVTDWRETPCEFIGLIGVPTSDAPDIFDVSAVQRTAQLVHELALRWEKLVQHHMKTHHSGDSAARSSQKPG
jgi:hypothetical protein